jgi:ParB family transcriptional regulator, chromosome partitioning protein
MALNDNGLGRSVSDVLAKTVRRNPEHARGYLEVDIGLVQPSTVNPRTHFEQGALDELAASISRHGILQPLVVCKREVGYELISGERRYRAARQAGLTKIPVVIRDDTNPQHLAELRLVENLQRQDLNPIELALGFQTLIESHGLSHDQLSDRVGKDRSTISNALRLLALPSAVRDQVVAGQLSAGHAKALLACSDPAWLLTLARRIISEGLSVRDTERLAKAGTPSAAPTPARDPQLRELETNLFHLLGVPVAIRQKGAQGAGTLAVHFTSREQFQRVVGVLEKVLKEAGVRPAGDHHGDDHHPA